MFGVALRGSLNERADIEFARMIWKNCPKSTFSPATTERWSNWFIETLVTAFESLIIEVQLLRQST